MDPQDPPGLAWCPIRRAWLPRDWVVQEQPQPDPRDAEIARLREDWSTAATTCDRLRAMMDKDRAEIARLRAALAEAVRIARDGCLVPPDGGSPTEEERLMCEDIADRIAALIPPDMR